MTFIQVALPGEYVDAYCYADRLIALDRRGQVCQWSMSDLAADLAKRKVVPSDRARSALDDNRIVGEAPKSSVVVQLDRPPMILATTGLQGVAIYDLLVTYFTLYISTAQGLVSLPLPAMRNSGAETLGSGPRLRIEGRVVAATSGFGAVVAAAGPRGLWALINEFGFSSSVQRGSRQLDDSVSGRTGWWGHSLYSADLKGEWRVFEPKLQAGDGRGEGQRSKPRVVTSVDEYDSERMDAPVLGRHQLPEPSLTETLVLPTASAVVAVFGDQLVMVPVGRWNGVFEERGPRVIVANAVDGHVWGVANCLGGLAVEQGNSVTAVDAAGSDVLLDHAAISVRSFPESRRYRRIVTTTSKAGIAVTCLFGTHPYPTDLGHLREVEIEGGRAYTPEFPET